MRRAATPVGPAPRSLFSIVQSTHEPVDVRLPLSACLALLVWRAHLGYIARWILRFQPPSLCQTLNGLSIETLLLYPVQTRASRAGVTTHGAEVGKGEGGVNGSRCPAQMNDSLGSMIHFSLPAIGDRKTQPVHQLMKPMRLTLVTYIFT